MKPTRAPRPILTAQWSNVLIVTFAVPDDLVRPLLHPQLELDRWEGKAHVSVVGLDFVDIRLRRVRVPRFSSFPALNLRTYVRSGNVRGVQFIRELVPSLLVAWVARTLFNEPFRAVTQRRHTKSIGEQIAVTHRIGRRQPRYRLAVLGSAPMPPPPEGSIEHHLKERLWGYGATRKGALYRFRVARDEWPVRPVQHFDCDIDFEALYGSRWKVLNETEPVSVILAVGSEVEVYGSRLVG